MGHVFDRSLAVLGGIADVLRLRPFNQRELVAQSFNNIFGLIKAERGLRNIRNAAWIGNFQSFHLFHAAYYLGHLRRFAECADDLIMIAVADENDAVIALGILD